MQTKHDKCPCLVLGCWQQILQNGKEKRETGKHQKIEIHRFTEPELAQFEHEKDGPCKNNGIDQNHKQGGSHGSRSIGKHNQTGCVVVHFSNFFDWI